MRTRYRSSWSRKLVTAIVTATAFTLMPLGVNAQSIRVKGSSFPEILYERYQSEYQQDTGVNLRYRALGSGRGIRLFISQLTDMGSSTLIPTPIEQAQMRDGLVMVPTAGGAIAIVYNLQNVSGKVKLSREQLVGIFTGDIGNWSQIHPRLPNRQINVVTRSDNSGTTFLLTKYLNKLSGGLIKASRQPDWGFELYAQRPQDSGVAAEVRRIDGAIGYVQSAFATQNDLPVAELENRSGRYVKPTVEETKKALANVQFNEDFTLDRFEEPEDGYPLVGLTWLLMYQKYESETALQSAQNFVNWVLTKGQEFNEEEEYSRIPEETAVKVREFINNQLKVRPY